MTAAQPRRIPRCLTRVIPRRSSILVGLGDSRVIMYHLAKSLYLYATSKEGMFPRSGNKKTPADHLLLNCRILRPFVRARQRRKDHSPVSDQSTLSTQSRWRTGAQPRQDRADRRPECRDRFIARHEPEDLGCGRANLDARPVAELLHQLSCNHLRG